MKTYIWISRKSHPERKGQSCFIPFDEKKRPFMDADRVYWFYVQFEDGEQIQANYGYLSKPEKLSFWERVKGFLVF